MELPPRTGQAAAEWLMPPGTGRASVPDRLRIARDPELAPNSTYDRQGALACRPWRFDAGDAITVVALLHANWAPELGAVGMHVASFFTVAYDAAAPDAPQDWAVFAEPLNPGCNEGAVPSGVPAMILPALPPSPSPGGGWTRTSPSQPAGVSSRPTGWALAALLACAVASGIGIATRWACGGRRPARAVSATYCNVVSDEGSLEPAYPGGLAGAVRSV